MPIDPPADDGGVTFLWTCTRCDDHGIAGTHLAARTALWAHRAEVHGAYGPVPCAGTKETACIDCGTPVLVRRIRQPRCPTHQAEHDRATARARRGAA